MGPGQRKPWDDGDTKGVELPPERTGIDATAARRLGSPFPTGAEAILSWMSHGPHWLRFDDDLPVYDRSSTALQLIALVAAAFFLLGGLTACPSRARRDFPTRRSSRREPGKFSTENITGRIRCATKSKLNTQPTRCS